MYDAVVQQIAHRVVRQDVSAQVHLNLAIMREKHALQVLSPTSVQMKVEPILCLLRMAMMKT